MDRTRALRIALLFPFLTSLALTGCGDDDGIPDSGVVDAGPRPDGEVETPDGGTPDGGGGVVVIECPAADAPAHASGAVCETTAGDANVLITADVLLADGSVLAGGQVLIGAGGAITCADCDCSAATGASGATRIDCPDGVLSPGLVNAHEHLTFQGHPAPDTGERYEHRHDWRQGRRDHTEIDGPQGAAHEILWAELRMVMGGATSVNGSGGATGFLRNLDNANMEGLGQPDAYYQTFPLGDGSSGSLLASGCEYPGRDDAARIAGEEAYTPHIAEGIDAEARNEFVCLSDGVTDVIAPQTAMIHGIALRPGDIDLASAEGTMLVWSPRSNIFLYGDTARVTEYDRLGVPIALGTDWIYSGSMNMLRELRCADDLNADYYDGYFADVDLWRMATLNGAIATATDDVIGSIAVGRVADLVVFDGSVNALHRAVIDAESADVALVLRGGVPLYGESAVVAALPTGDACDEIEICGSARRACVSREASMTLAALTAANAGSYPLVFCDGATPDLEPSCHPARADYPSGLPVMPSVDGSSVYTGMITADDPDGDGITDGDNCPRVFNPIRPLDMGAQADVDLDGVGDSCDPCPLDPDSTTCTMRDPNDGDRDGVVDTEDNCPGLSNADQADADADGAGDVCDACPMTANPGGAACPASIYDVQNGTIAEGSRVSVRGVVTAIATNGFFAQVAADDPDYVGADDSGLFVYTGGAPTQSRGDAVTIDGMATAFFGETQLMSSLAQVMVTGTTAVPAPVDVMASEVATGGARADALQGVLVRVMNVSVSDIAPPPEGMDTAPTNEFEIEGSLRVDDLFFLLDPFPALGETFSSIVGVLTFRRDNSKLHPRDADDVIAGTPQLLELAPALSFVREGAASGPTFPEPLTVRLTRAVATATTVTLTSGAGVTVADVMIPAGMSSAVVPVTGVTASATPVGITAELAGVMRSANVRVLGATEAPADFTLAPATASVRVGTTQVFTVTTDIPAPAGGTTITLAETTGGTLPASVTVPEGQTTASVTFTAGATGATGTLTATMGAVVRMAALEVTEAGPGTVIINEVDYDQPGADGAEFLELYNPGATAFDLTGVEVVLVNGSGGAVYGTIPLSGMLAPGAYLVIGTGGTIALPIAIQNGAPDGIAIVRGTELIDALSYEGSMPAVTINGTTHSLVEGTASTADDAGLAGSLSRIPNGQDTNDADADWAYTTMPTPGAANVADPTM